MMFRLPDQAALEAIKSRMAGSTRTIAPLTIKPAPKPVRIKTGKPRATLAPILSESSEQKLLIRWFGLFAPTVGLDPRLLFSIPNGTYFAGNTVRRAIQSANLKATGLRPGIPDLFLAVPKPGSGGLFIEMKRLSGRPTVGQIQVHAVLRAAGYRCKVCCGADEAIAMIKDYLEQISAEAE